MRYGYARVSTFGQSLDDQVSQLKSRGIDAKNIFADKFTGKSLKRPELQKLLSNIKRNDEVVVVKLDRLARSVKDGLDLIDKLNEEHVTVTVLSQGMSFTGEDNSIQNMMKQMLLMFAEFERTQIVERTQAGKEYQRKHNPNFKEGRKRKGTRNERKHAYDLLKQHSYTEVADMTGYSRSTVQRIWREFKRQDTK